jgi:hypothetical protein
LAFAFVAGELGRQQPAVAGGGMLAALLEQVRADRRQIAVVAQPRIAGLLVELGQGGLGAVDHRDRNRAG